MEPTAVLVVDDDRSLGFVIAAALKRAGRRVEVRENGAAALELLAQDPSIAVMVTDMVMPGMDGIELCRQARQVNADLEMLVMTGAATVQAAVAALRDAGAYDFLMKPFESMQQLVLAVSRAVEYRRLRIENSALQARNQLQVERFEALVANSGDAILGLDGDDRLALINPAARRLLGETAQVGLDLEHGLPPVLNNLIKTWQTAGSAQPVSVELNWPAQAVHLVSLTPLSANGERGAFLILRNITHLKRLEVLQREALRDAVNKLGLPLARAMSILAELNALTMDDERINEVVYRLTKVWTSIQKWEEDLNEMVQMVTGHDGRVNLVDLGSLLDETVQAPFQDIAVGRNLHLQLERQADLPPVSTNPEVVSRLFQLLLKRAVMRSAPGGTVGVRVQPQKEFVWISIEDDGPPANELDFPRLLDRSVALQTGPFDLDFELNLVRTVMNRINGQVWLGKRGEVGSAVKVCLPFA